MSTPAEHYQEAQEWLRRAAQAWENEDADPVVSSAVAHSAAAIAQVHMTAATHPLAESHPNAPIPGSTRRVP